MKLKFQNAQFADIYNLYPIVILFKLFCGGINRGGVYLDKSYLYQGKTLTVDELQVINKAPLHCCRNVKTKMLIPKLLKI